MSGILVLFGTLLIATLLGFPIFFNFLFASLLTIILDPALTMDVVMSPLYYSLNNFPLLAIPLFMYAGDLMIQGNLSKRMVALAQLVAGKLPGNLGGVTVVASAFYGAVCGSGPATAAVVGGMMEPDMKKAGYPRGYTAALIAAAGVLGMLIPPSNPAILLGFATGISTTDLFLTILLPGILLTLILLAWNTLVAKFGHTIPKNKIEKINPAKIIKEGIWALFMPILILGGIYGGIFTPTEAAAISCVYALFVGFFVYKSFTLKKLIQVTKQSAHGILTIMLGIVFISIFTRIVTIYGVADALVTFVTSVTTSKVLILIMINILMLIQGMFIDPLAGVMLIGPLLYPLCVNYLGLAPLHFGTIVVVNLAIGVTTPPLAINIFVAMRQTGATLGEVLKHLMPMIGLQILVAFIVTFVPWLSLALVG